MSDHQMIEGKKIQVVDDEPDILEVLEELLDMCQVISASSFDQAKKLLESQDFDIVILDIMGVDGYALLAIANQKNLPVLMLTADAFSSDHLVKTIRAGANAYVPKEKIGQIVDFLTDVLKAQQSGENPWRAWEERLPSSFFEKRWGAAWKDTDREFWDKFRESIKSRK